MSDVEDNLVKHIKVKAKLINNMKEAELTILEQSHRNYEFGDADGNKFIFNRTALGSFSYPEWLENTYDSRYDKVLCVQGDGRSRDAETAIVPIHQWPALKATIEAYNEYYKD